MKGLRLVPEETHINFIGMRFVTYILSALLMIGSIGYVIKNNLNFGIDFVGGTLIEVRVPEIPDLAMLRTDLNGTNLGAISLQEFGAPQDLLIRLPEQKGSEELAPEEAQKLAIEKVRGVLESSFEGDIDYRRTEYVGPQVGEELKKQGLYAVLFSLLGILAYVSFRFEWQFGLAAILALAHDTIATIGLFSLTQMEFNLSTVAAILMIAGYSINDTVVVFDRVRENLRKYRKKPLDEILNNSINQTLARTIMTSVTTMLALMALWAFGGEVIQGFVNALIFGVLIGTYSSIFVAAPVLMLIHRRRKTGAEDSAEQVPA